MHAMNTALSKEAISQLFTEARTHHAWRDTPVSDGLLLEVYELAKRRPTRSGFDDAKVDQVFFENSSWRSNFLCNIGYGDAAKLYPRGPRLRFDQACIIV